MNPAVRSDEDVQHGVLPCPIGDEWTVPIIKRRNQAHFYQGFPDARRLANCDILVAFYAGYHHVSLATDDCPLGGRLCFVRSSNEGHTWGPPAVLYDDADEAKKTGFPACAPHLNRLSDGTILPSHRLPKTSIHISHDDTQTWEGPFLVYSCIGAYPATVELKDHSVPIVFYTEGGGSTIRACRFDLKPGGIEFLPLLNQTLHDDAPDPL